MILDVETMLIDALSSAHAGNAEVRESVSGDRRVISIPSSGLTIEAFPDDVDAFILRSTSSILIHYAGSEFSEPDGSEIVRQVEFPVFNIMTVSRNLRSNVGCYALMDKTQRCLM